MLQWRSSASLLSWVGREEWKMCRVSLALKRRNGSHPCCKGREQSGVTGKSMDFGLSIALIQVPASSTFCATLGVDLCASISSSSYGDHYAVHRGPRKDEMSERGAWPGSWQQLSPSSLWPSWSRPSGTAEQRRGHSCPKLSLPPRSDFCSSFGLLCPFLYF